MLELALLDPPLSFSKEPVVLFHPPLLLPPLVELLLVVAMFLTFPVRGLFLEFAELPVFLALEAAAVFLPPVIAETPGAVVPGKSFVGVVPALGMTSMFPHVTLVLEPVTP